MKRLLILSLIGCNSLLYCAPLGEYTYPAIYVSEPSYKFAPENLTNEQHLREMRGYPYPASYDTADPLKPYGQSAKDIADQFKRQESDLLE